MAKQGIQIALPDSCYRKIKEFSEKNFVSYSEIFTVLLENCGSDISTRDKSTALKDSRRDREIDSKNVNIIQISLSKELKKKMDEIRLKNKTTNPEIARTLIGNADFDRLKFRTIGEVYSETLIPVKQSNLSKDKISININLEKEIYKKLKEFSIRNYISISEVFRTLIENSETKLNIKHKTIFYEKAITLHLNEKLTNKLKEMVLENNASPSEIVVNLVETTDLSKMKFKTLGEVFSEARKLIKKK